MTEAAQANAKPAPYQFSAEILREYDVRGQIGKNLSESDAYALGLAFGTKIRRLGGEQICVGFDGRNSSPGLADAAVRGMTETGCHVEVIGLGPTPMLYYAVKDRKADGGMMITGSHNPSDYNGFKMTLQSGPVFGAAVQDLGRIAAAGDFESGTGSRTDIDITEKYIDRLLQDLDLQGKEMKVAWDCGNGAAGDIVRRLTAKMPGEHILLFDEIDGSFPNHHPDPTVDENLEDLIKTVRAEGCDIGVAFDGDADRIGAVDEQGNVIRCDMMLTIYAREVLRDHPGATIIGDVKCSQVMYDEIERLGGKPIMWKTGHSVIKAKMAEENSPLSGELSGHIFFGHKWYGFDDGIYCVIRLLNESAKADGPVSSLTVHLPSIHNTPEIRFEVDESRKFQLVSDIAATIKPQAEDAGFDVNEIDGVRVSTDYGWWLIRASNTQNVLVTRAEADTPENLKKLTDMVCDAVNRVGYEVTFPE